MKNLEFKVVSIDGYEYAEMHKGSSTSIEIICKDKNGEYFEPVNYISKFRDDFFGRYGDAAESILNGDADVIEKNILGDYIVKFYLDRTIGDKRRKEFIESSPIIKCKNFKYVIYNPHSGMVGAYYSDKGIVTSFSETFDPKTFDTEEEAEEVCTKIIRAAKKKYDETNEDVMFNGVVLDDRDHSSFYPDLTKINFYWRVVQLGDDKGCV